MKRLLLLATTLLIFAPTFCCSYLWYRSYTQTDDIYSYSPGRMTRFRTSGGGFWFETRPWEPNTTAKLDWQVYPDRALYPFAAGPDDPWYERLGILVNTKDYDLLLAAPYWLLLLFSSPTPLWFLWYQSKHRASKSISTAPTT